MPSIRIFAYICFGLSALAIVLAVLEEFVFFAPALALFVSGVLLLALNKIITTLIEIRDALLGPIGVVEERSSEVDTLAEAESKPLRSLKEISGDLDRMKQRIE